MCPQTRDNLIIGILLSVASQAVALDCYDFNKEFTGQAPSNIPHSTETCTGSNPSCLEYSASGELGSIVGGGCVNDTEAYTCADVSASAEAALMLSADGFGNAGSEDGAGNFSVSVPSGQTVVLGTVPCSKDFEFYVTAPGMGTMYDVDVELKDLELNEYVVAPDMYQLPTTLTYRDVSVEYSGLAGSDGSFSNEFIKLTGTTPFRMEMSVTSYSMEDGNVTVTYSRLGTSACNPVALQIDCDESCKTDLCNGQYLSAPTPTTDDDDDVNVGLAVGLGVGGAAVVGGAAATIFNMCPSQARSTVSPSTVSPA